VRHDRFVARLIATLAIALGALALSAAPAGAADDPARFVDPLVGTGGPAHHTFPGAVLPFGMVQLSPVAARSTDPSGYAYDDPTTRGFAFTRLSGAGCTNSGDLPIMPLLAPFTRLLSDDPSYYATYRHAREHATAGRYRVTLANGIEVDLTATTRTGFATFRFPARRAWLSLDAGGSAVDQNEVSVDVASSTEVRGSETTMGFCNAPARSRVFFVARFDHPLESAATWDEDGVVGAGVRQRRTINTGGALVGFRLGANRTLRVKVGISYVSVANAALNLDRESPGWNGDALAARARAAWNAQLAKVRVEGGTAAERRTFYTALYHALIHPTVFEDVNGEYLGRDQLVHVARGYTRYTNVSGWDIYRTQIPLLALLAPRVASDVAQSLVAGAQEGGRLSRWSFASWEPGVMVGDPADAILAGAYAFGARAFDTRAALAEMVEGATVAQPGPYVFPANAAPYSNARDARPDAWYVQRPGLAWYLQLGYVPSDQPDGFLWGPAATTLEYAVADFALAQFAAAVGLPELAAPFLRRAGNWRTLVNPATGFVEPRRADGSFLPGYAHDVESGFVEGSSSQYTWSVPHDVAGLAETLGGAARVADRLDTFFARLNSGQDSANAWLGNEPSLGAPWLYLWLGRPARTQAVVRRAQTSLYGPSPAAIPGDDDLGTLSSWYVWSALGLYPAIPGVGGFAVGSPLFPRATVSTGLGTLTISAPRAAAARPFVRGATLDGRAFERTWLPLASLRGRHTLSFDLAATPRRWGATSPPPSFPPPR